MYSQAPPPQQYAPPPQGYYQNAAPAQPPPQGYYPPQGQQYPQQYRQPPPGQAVGYPSGTYPPQQLGANIENLPQVERALADMQTRGMMNDPRYNQMISIANRLRAQQQHQPPVSEPSPIPAGPKQTMTEQEQAMFDAQVSVYRQLSRQLPVPTELSIKAMRDPTKTVAPLLPEPYSQPGTGANGEKLPFNLMSILQLHQQRNQNRVTSVPKPAGIDPALVMKERENRIANRIGERIVELESIVATCDEEIRSKVEIELRSLRLLNLQKQLRSEVLAIAKRDTTLETALNPNAYRRTKKQALKEARVTEKLEKAQKQAQERKRRERHREFLEAIVNHCKEFREFHRHANNRINKLKRAMATHLANAEKERKKDEEKRERERMQKLMQEDEEGYRKLLDQKKDKRLVFLLSQTDEYISSLTGLVASHQQEQEAIKKQERQAAKQQRRRERELKRAAAAAAAGDVSQDAGDVSMSQDAAEVVKIREISSGRILHGDEVPTDVEDFLAKNPGYELLARGDSDDDSNASDDEISTNEAEKENQAREKLEKEREEERARLARGEELPAEGDLETGSQEIKPPEDDEYNAKGCADEQESYYGTAHSIREKVTTQPTVLVGGQLKPYQIRGLEWLVSLFNNNLNGILADEMGLGKTIQTIALVTYLMEYKKNKGPYLIIVPLSTISNWELEFQKWAPSVVPIIYKGTPPHRRTLQACVRHGKFNVLLTTYDYVIKDKSVLAKIHWKYMIIDEGHRMKNHHNKLTSVLNTYYTAPHRLLLTGTPLQNKLPELWALLNFLLPSIFKSVSTFEQWFNAPFATTGEKVELNPEETMLIIRRLHKVLRPFLLRRLKKEVEAQLPEKTEYVIKCDMSALQRVLYRSLEKGLLVGGNNSGARAVMNTVMQLRKLCNHPFLWEHVENDCKAFWGIDYITGKELIRVSGKFELLDRILPKLKDTGHKVLMFCQMTQLMTIMEDFLNYRGYKYLRLDGSTKTDDRGELLKHFNAKDSDYFLFMLSTRAGGLGLNLQSADTVIIFDSDWNPHQDLQAQDRAHRIGQVREVRVLRLLTVQSVEERILAAARNKLSMDSKVIQAGLFDNKSTNAERKKFLEALIHADVDDDEENDVPDDETINQMLARSEEEFDQFQRMDIERRRQEAAEIRRKPRLVEPEEVPEQFHQQSQVAEQMSQGLLSQNDADKIMFGDSKRRRKEVNYASDLMSDRDWLREYADEDIEADDGEETGLENTPVSKRGTHRGARFTGRRRKADEMGEGGSVRKRKTYIDDDDDEESRASTPVKRGRGKRAKTPPPDYVVPICEKMYRIITQLKTPDDRVLAEPFIRLPTRSELPDYYERIERPMDFYRIERKIKTNKYRSVDEMSSDVQLLCANAQEYNCDESLIFQDSQTLHKTWLDLRGKFAPQEAKMKAEYDAVHPPKQQQADSDASRSQSRADSVIDNVAPQQPMPPPGLQQNQSITLSQGQQPMLTMQQLETMQPPTQQVQPLRAPPDGVMDLSTK